MNTHRWTRFQYWLCYHSPLVPTITTHTILVSNCAYIQHRLWGITIWTEELF